MRRTTWTLKSELPRESGRLVQHISQALRDAIVAGELQPGDQLPASRQLARDLKVARGTITTAVEMLVAEGLVEAHVGAGSFVSKDAALCPTETGRIAATIGRMPTAIPVPKIDREVTSGIDFRPCIPSMEGFPIAVWRRCVAAAASATPSGDYDNPRGDHRLRSAIADYLRRARGLRATPAQILVSNGSVHAMHLLSQLYLDKQSKVIFEEPGYPLARQVFELTGAAILPSPVDDDGLQVECLPTSTNDIRFIYVTPSHQFPTGGRLSLGRRRALIDWADQRGAIVIEDDYDGAFRYDVPPLAPMAALPNKSVVYCGTFSKTLFPGLRLGYAIAPKPLIDAIAAYRAVTEYAPNAIIQTALAKFIADGHYERHIHRMSRLYANKRRALESALSQHGCPAMLSGLESGLHGYLQLPGVSDAAAIAADARKQGIILPTVRQYSANASTTDNALILGYSALSTEQIANGVQQIFSLKWNR